MPFVDDVKEQVCGIRAVREIADLVDDQDGWMRVDLQRLRELSWRNAAERSSVKVAAVVKKTSKPSR